MWLLLKIQELGQMYPEIIYLSYKGELAGMHIRNIKRLVEVNPYFMDYGYQDVSMRAETILKYKHGLKTFTVGPAGILSFQRGKHTMGLVTDDPLQDPQGVKMDIGQIDKVTRLFLEQVVSIKKERGFSFHHVLGTAQDEADLFFKLRNLRGFDWHEYKAILNYRKKQVLWPEMFPYAKLIDIRDNQIGAKAFNKEFMCTPVRSEEKFCSTESVMGAMGGRQNINIRKYKTDNRIVAGMDIGKKTHPSHISVLELVPILAKEDDPDNKISKGDTIGHFKKQLISKWLDHANYTRQITYCRDLIDSLGIDRMLYDNTRAEFESFEENGELPAEMEGVVMTSKGQHKMATLLDKALGADEIEFIHDERQARQILAVDNDLKAMSTSEGHGDSFWSNCLALAAAEEGSVSVRWI
jgi:hypothetical protein